MTEEHFAAQMSQAKLSIPEHRREQLSTKPPKSCRDASGRNSLLAIGSWSIETHRRVMIPQGSSDFNLNDEAFGEPSLNWSSEPMMEDFVLFPEEIPEDDTQNGRASSPPRAPRISRLRTPDIAPLSTDVQFFPCLGNEDEQDRVNEAWYLAGRERLDAQIDNAIAYMAGVDGHARMLGQ
ncbi:hypothetical protein C8035_v006030 [Colletotrichum spinosum]|uniref:Uncharacterized protein n=1 Tax=Colletotrichum spinosum TaxID=1347390 RepID=A0A4R8Q8K8_9PEZI|nr:hypothetical protein C8035_v006030 [Colletotrichum spinosum]